MAKLFSTGTSSELARIRLERWLAACPPRSIGEYTDRVFARTVQGRDPYGDAELCALLLVRVNFAKRLQNQLEQGVVCTHLLDGLRLAWVFRRHGIPAHELERDVEKHAKRLADAADAWQEPARSTFFYWVARLGWASRPACHELEEGEPSADSLLMQCDFGERPVPRAELPLQVSLPEDAGLLAAALVAEASATPVDPAAQNQLLGRLIALQRQDGSFVTSGGASPHGTACTALVAMSLAQAGTLQADLRKAKRNLG